jgi:hypothetical protein
MNIRSCRPIVAIAFAAILTAAPASAEVQLTMRDGRVSLKATNATLREILAEWARIGQARIINGERIAGAPLTLELTNVTEGQALDVLLRTVATYMAAPRPVAMPNASQFDRILILPTSTPPRVTAAPPTPTFQPQPQFTPPPQVDDQDDFRNGPVPNPRGPIFNTFPQPGQPTAQPVPVPGMGVPAGVTVPAGINAPGGQMPVGVSVPGMVVPAPPQPGQIQLPPGQVQPQ